MRYQNTVKATFIDRPNRFIAHVELDGHVETVHVKNTGRCKELLLPGVTVILEDVNFPSRKTRYDLIAVYKENFGLINIDSLAPNKVAMEWLSEMGYSLIRPEYTYGESRIDFYLEDGTQKILMEVKGCTLERGGIGYFPDAPTARGVKHLRELIKAKKEGYQSILCFVVQMENIYEVRPNVTTHKEFGDVFDEARAAGVEVLILPCQVTEDSLTALF